MSAFDTVSFLNASYIFESIELGSAEQEEFLDQFTHGGNNTALTLINHARFNNLLEAYLKTLEDHAEELEEFQSVKYWYQEIKYVNIEN